MIAPYQPQTEHPLIDPNQARTVMGVLALLVRTAGPRTSLGIILQQARSEIASLVESEQACQIARQCGLHLILS